MSSFVKRQSLKKAQLAKRSSDAVVEQCGGCGAAVALRPPTIGVAVAAWCCEKCGALYFGADQQSAEEGLSGLVRAPETLFCQPVKKRQTSVKNGADERPLLRTGPTSDRRSMSSGC